MSHETQMLLGLFLGIAIMIFLVMKTKTHTFIALLLAALITGLIGKMSPSDAITAIQDGFGNTLKSTGIIIGLGVMMGGILEKTGAAERMAYSFIKKIGSGKEELALGITGWLVSIPVFADSAVVIFAPLCKALSRVSGKSVIGLALAMALPGMDRERFKQRLAFKMPRKGGWLLILFMGAATAFAALSLNMLEYRLLAHTGLRLTIASLPMPLGGMSFAWRLLIGVVIAALVEEIYLRGALFSVYGEEVGTSACLLFGGIVFALLHGSPLDLAAGFCAGLAFTYLTYVFDTVWAAVLSHAAAAFVTVAMQWIADTYALGKMLARGSIPHFEVSAGWYDLWLLVKEPGFIVFVLAFAGKIILNYWIG